MYLNDKTDILHVHSSVYPFILRDYITKINLAFVDFKGPHILGSPAAFMTNSILMGCCIYQKFQILFFEYFIGNTLLVLVKYKYSYKCLSRDSAWEMG